jgi:hypothetical protein
MSNEVVEGNDNLYTSPHQHTYQYRRCLSIKNHVSKTGRVSKPILQIFRKSKLCSSSKFRMTHLMLSMHKCVDLANLHPSNASPHTGDQKRRHQATSSRELNTCSQKSRVHPGFRTFRTNALRVCSSSGTKHRARMEMRLSTELSSCNPART